MESIEFAKQLRIGNYFRYSHTKNVDEIRNGKQIDEYIGAYEPIPLTDGWLLRLGFIYVQLSNKKEYKKYVSYIGVRVNGYIDESTFYVVLKGRTERIQYVHQLQNLYFALTGQELTLEK